MIKNILIYIAVLAISFSFAVFYYAWFSNFLLIVVVCLPVLSLYFDFALCFFFFISFFCGRLFYRRYLSVDFDLSFLCLAEKKRGEKNSRDDHTCPDVGIYLVLFCLGIELFSKELLPTDRNSVYRLHTREFSEVRERIYYPTEPFVHSHKQY